jgi:hypothetical protein
MTRLKPNWTAPFMLWVALAALGVLAWNHLRIARALEDLAMRAGGWRDHRALGEPVNELPRGPTDSGARAEAR